MFRHYVYVHRRMDNGCVFYVGNGAMRKRDKLQRYERAHSKSRRSAWWSAIAGKHGYSVEIVAYCVDDDAAQELEKAMIAQYGRANLGKGTLVNLTDGGDGHCGLIQTESQKRARSENAKRPRTRAWVDSIRRARKNGGNGGVVKAGDKLPAAWRASIAATKLGERNPMFGRNGDAHPRSRRVIDEASGTAYPSMTAAANAAGMKVGTLYNMLVGTNQNRTSMRFA